MTHCVYDNKRIIPAPPSVSIQKQYQKTQDATSVGTLFIITINGTMVADRGSPMTDGTFWTASGYPPDENVGDSARLAAVLRKQEAMRRLFSVEGASFEIQSADGSPPLRCNPIVSDISFGEGLWYQRCEYTIVLQASVIYMNGQLIGEDTFSEYISDASESWSFDVEETPEGINLPRTYRLSHSVSATGKRFYDETGTLEKPAWEQARDYVLPKLGYSITAAANTGVNNLPGTYNGYNFSRSQQQDELAGQYAVTENWILAIGKALEEFTCDIKNDSGDGLTKVSISGAIIGLEERDSNVELLTTKYENALDKWTSVESTLLTRAQSYSGITLNPFPISKLVGKNEITGQINYSYEYDNRPTNLFTGVNYESISINETFPSDLFAAIAVIGRANGPVLQDLSSQTERSVSLNIEVVVEPTTFGSGSVTDLRTAFYSSNPRIAQPLVFDNIIQAARPGLNYSTNKEFIKTQGESWDPKSGRWSFNIEWTFGN